MLFDLIGDREIFHRDVALALSVAEQLTDTEPKTSRALTGTKSAVTTQSRTVRLPTHAVIQRRSGERPESTLLGHSAQQPVHCSASSVAQRFHMVV
jgi:hypothetical protein